MAFLNFILSWGGAFPSSLVESWYARGAFPVVSSIAARFADAFAFSWLDVALILGVIGLLLSLRARRYLLLANLVAVVYLLFFWTWGLNYHRQALASKLPHDSTLGSPEAIQDFARRAALEINLVYAERQSQVHNEDLIVAEVHARVGRVMAVVDGLEWRAPSRIKTSWIANAWFHAAGIDGVFNPFGQEPIISNTLLDVERPFVIAHELAHVRGYPDEGDANLIALFATVMSSDRMLQYSGWLNLWLYLRTRELDSLLDPGPRQDLQRIFERAKSEQIPWISHIQTVMLDLYLRSNSVEEGVRSYSRVVTLAAETEPYWNQFR